MFISVDIDGVLCNMMGGLLPVANAKYGTDVKYEDVDDWFYKNDRWNLSHEIKKLFADKTFLLSLQPMKGAREGMAKLKADGNRVMIITSRNQRYFLETSNWVYGNIGSFTVYHAVDSKYQPDIELHIDDCIAQVKEFNEHNVTTMLFDQPWNQGYEHPLNLRVHGWDEIVSHTERMAKVEAEMATA